MTALVLGATGNVGPHVVSALLAQGTPTRVMTRDAARARLGAAVEVAQGDVGREADLLAAADGVDSVFLLTPHDFDATGLQLRIIRALRRTGIRIVKLSGTSSAIRPDGPHALRQHWEVEQVLTGSGQPFAIVRPNAFMQTLIDQIMRPAIAATGKIPNPVAGAGISMIDASDVGRVAAAVLASDRWDGGTLVLTGPRAVGYAEIADLIGHVRGEPIETLEITPADVRRSLLERGLEEWEAGHFQEMYQLFRNGESAYVTDVVEQVTGHPARTIEDYITGEAASHAA